MRAEQILATANDKNVVEGWEDAHRYSPAPRHRRRLIVNAIKELKFGDCLDIGCAHPFLLEMICRRFGVEGYGCDISDRVIEANTKILPDCQFKELDITQETWPGKRKFDLVICSEVLEHIPEWRSALANVVKMSRRHVLITVPSGPRRTMDRLVGHFQHFQGSELSEELENIGCKVKHTRYWGFPVHSLYKWAISRYDATQLYDSYAVGDYSLTQKLLSSGLYLAFFANDLFSKGCQLLIHATVADMAHGNC